MLLDSAVAQAMLISNRLVFAVVQGALSSLKQIVPAVCNAEASDLQKLSFVVGLVLLKD